MSSASKVFHDRSSGIPQAALEQLDKLQQQYQATGSEVLNAWESLALSSPELASSSWPQDEAGFGALRKQLELYAARKKKTREIPAVSTIKTPFKNVATPPPQKKRTGTEISPPTDAKRQLSMDQLSSIPVYVAPAFASGSEFISSPMHVEILPANEWTSRWMSTSPEKFLYMNATLDSITEQLRSDVSAFGEEALARKLIPAPSARVAPGNVAEEGKPAEEASSEFVTDFDKVGATVQSRNVVVCGRIVCESENGKLNAKSVLLEGVNGIRVKLELEAFRGRFSLFPGQHVIVEGISTGSSRIRVQKIFDGMSSPAPALPDSADTRIWVASGPYTGSEDLRFEYLDALLAQVSRANPDVLILQGPFVDANHPSILSGRPAIQIGGQIMNDLGFEDVLCFFLQRILSGLRDAKTKVCLVPCVDEVTHPVVAFPQPSLELPDEFAANSRLVSLPNPAVIKVNNIVFGMANVDTLFDFQDEGCAVQGYDPKENMGRLASHVLRQRSFYPIVPPSPDSSVDLSGRKNFELPPVDVLFLPSRLQSFAQDINGVLCINPGRSATAKTKMTVARLEIHASKSEIKDSTGGASQGTNIARSRSKVEFFAVG